MTFIELRLNNSNIYIPAELFICYVLKTGNKQEI